MKPIQNLTLIITLLLLNSCRYHKPDTTIAVSDLKDVASWQFSGKMFIKGEYESGSGRVEWISKNNKVHAKFTAPLGQGSWEIKELMDRTELFSSKNGTNFAESTETLLQHELGWDFPWQELSFWLRGLQSQESHNNNKNKPAVFNERGWIIEYKQWMSTPVGDMPKRITATNPPYQIKLSIRSWSFE